MPFWDEASGAIELAEGARLLSHMSVTDLLNVFSRLTDAKPCYDPTQNDPIVPFPAFSAEGGRLAAVCFVHADHLHAVEFSVEAVGQKEHGTADQQRALLFRCLNAQDPARDSKRGVMLRCPFGTALVATDPHCGDATLRITYK